MVPRSHPCFLLWAEEFYLLVYLDEMIIETSVASIQLSGCTEVPIIHQDHLIRGLVPPHVVTNIWSVQFLGFSPVFFMNFLLKTGSDAPEPSCCH